MKYFIFIFSLLLLFEKSLAADIYKCNINGRLTYTDVPCNGEVVSLPPINSTASNGANTKYNSSKWFFNSQGYREALKVSERYNAPLFIFFEADWCSYCRKLETELLHKAEAKYALRPFISVQISPEDGASENSFFKSLGGAGYPTIFIQKNASSKPQRTRLNTRLSNGKWRTKSVSEFKKLLLSFLP
jgi:thiol:disulfide interchange protein